MSGMEPMLIGAALGGGMSAARGGNPITGALLGGIGGGVYGAASGMASAAAAPAVAGEITAQPALSYAAGKTAAGQAMTNPGIMSTLNQVPNAFGQFSSQNPLMANMGSQALKSEFAGQQPMSMAPSAGLLRGHQMQQQPSQYAMARPQISLI
jgi:hypothetical protein